MSERPERIFSGDRSRGMWNAINEARTNADLADALYLVCCRIQRLEARMEKRWAGWDGRGEHPALPFSVHPGAHDLFQVIFDRDEERGVFSSKSQAVAAELCWILNKFLAGRVSGLTGEGSSVPGGMNAARACDAEVRIRKGPYCSACVWWSDGEPFEVYNWSSTDGHSVEFMPDARQVLDSLSCVDTIKLCEILNECWVFSKEGG